MKSVRVVFCTLSSNDFNFWHSSGFFWKDLSIQRTNSRAKPWSVIARVGEGKDTPDPSVFRFFNSSEQSLLSPRLVSTSPRSLSPVPSLGFQRTADPESASLLSSADSRLYKTKESGYGEYNDKDTCIPKSGSDISSMYLYSLELEILCW